MEEKPQRRSFSWAMMMALVILTMLVAIGLAYLVTMRNLPAGH
jgi:hypothetical protein